MSKKVYVKPPHVMRAMAIMQIIVGGLFLPLGIMFVFIAEGEARPFAAIFALIWSAVCIAIITIGIKMLRFVKKDKIHIAEIEDSDVDIKKV